MSGDLENELQTLLNYMHKNYDRIMKADEAARAFIKSILSNAVEYYSDEEIYNAIKMGLQRRLRSYADSVRILSVLMPEYAAKRRSMKENPDDAHLYDL